MCVISGEVRDGRPLATNPNLVLPRDLPTVPGATIRVLNLGLTAASDPSGRFSFADISVTPPCMKIDVGASAPGFGVWRMTGIPVYPGGTRLYIQLEAQPQTLTYQAGRAAAQGLSLCH